MENPASHSSPVDEIYSPDQLATINLDMVPPHMAIIMDGNRRWAQERDLPAMAGHAQGVKALFETVRAASSLGVRALTVFGMSTENWNRSAMEVGGLLHVMEQALAEYRQAMVREGVAFHTIGDLSRFPDRLVEGLQETSRVTSGGEKIDLIVALNYGGKDDIRRGLLALLDDVEAGSLSRNEITEEKIASYLDTSRWGDPSLLVRTSGEQRLSNFLLWQASYAEIISTDVLWPDFGPKALLNVIGDYQSREQRRGH